MSQDLLGQNRAKKTGLYPGRVLRPKQFSDGYTQGFG